MSGRGIGDLGLPPLRYRVDKGSAARRSAFETLRQSRAEDLVRARKLCKAASKYPKQVNAGAALALACKLERAAAGCGAADSIASSTHMRGQRVNVAGALWQLIRRAGAKNVRSFTIIPRTWEISADELGNEDPRKRMRTLLAALYKAGAKDADGWIIAFIHGEWDPVGTVYRLHVHGFAYGGMIDAIDRLRRMPNYRSRRRLKDGTLSPVYRRVRMSREMLKGVPYLVTYRLQSYWPAKALIIADDGSRVRARRKGRIAEPYHSQVLLWMDRWRVDDLTLMVGLRVTKGGLRQTKPVS